MAVAPLLATAALLAAGPAAAHSLDEHAAAGAPWRPEAWLLALLAASALLYAAGLALAARLLARPEVSPASAARPALPRSAAS